MNQVNYHRLIYSFAQNYLNIKKVEVYDINGRLLKAFNNVLNLSIQTSGVYFLKIYTNSEIYNTTIIRK